MSRRLALFLMDEGGYQLELRDEFLATTREYGFSARVFSADNDPQRQVKQIDGCLAEPKELRPTVVLVSPVREGALMSTAHAAVRSGVGWVTLNRSSDQLAELRRDFHNLPVFCVTADQYEVGRIQGRQFKTLLPYGGELVYIRGPIGTSSVVRRFAGVQEILANTSIQIFALSSDWTAAGGERTLQDWLRIFRGRELPAAVVGAQNDSMGMGAQNALVAPLRSGRVLFTGCDGAPNHGQRWATEGRLAATVIIPPVSGRAVHAIASMLSGGPRPAAETLLSPSSFPPLSILASRVGHDSSLARAGHLR
ncbi:MAG: substrate-binding domain-containing protein [Myxococcota bacterium]|nr:substrate-binding domain-containing protein [Myxococcota bacterium]